MPPVLTRHSANIPSAAKKNRDDGQAKRDANDRNISEYFTKGAGKAQPKPKVSQLLFLWDLIVEPSVD